MREMPRPAAEERRYMQQPERRQSPRETLAIFDTGQKKDEDTTWKVTYVPPACYRTMNFAKESDVVMGSVDNTGPYTTPVVLIQRKDNNSLVTMVNLAVASVDYESLYDSHSIPAARVFEKALYDFNEAGGKVNENQGDIQVTVMGGASFGDAKGEFLHAMKAIKHKYKCDFVEHKESLCSDEDRAAVFVCGQGTQILKFKGNMLKAFELQNPRLVTKENPALPLNTLLEFSERIPEQYRQHLFERVDAVHRDNPCTVINAKLLYAQSQQKQAEIAK